MPHQPSLFPPDEGDAPTRRAASSDDAPLEERRARLRAVAAALPPGVRLGTSSWSFPGWHGLVYRSRNTAAGLARDGLREYVQHPLFSTVGVDRSYYARIPDDDFQRYAGQLPPGFPCCCKAPARVTSPVLPERGSRAANPGFLSADDLIDSLLEPVARLFHDHAGPFILQFPPILRRSGLAPDVFLEGLDRLLESLPHEFQYGVELRDRGLLSDGYGRVLARHRAGHVYNVWTAVPLPGEQAEQLPPESMPFVMVRWLLGPGATYEQQREAFAPFDRIQAPDEGIRGQVVDLVARAVARAIPAYVLVNNKAEGSAPLTIEALAARLARDAPRDQEPPRD
ncbi:MAG TPA: DUF72 domain-containing protein [Vicinamibacterales bacterium]|jgi:uncharacterized protein YecE (DUF72 family)